MNTLYASIRLIRPGTTLSGVLATIIGGYVATNANPDWSRLLLATLVVALVQGAGNTANDIYDLKIDQINKPRRPLPSGQITRKGATILAVSLTAMGIIVSFLLGATNVIVASIVTIALYLYAAYLKKTLLVKNITVAFVSSLTVVYGAATVGDITQVLTLALVVFLGIFAREILKDMADEEGDRTGQAKTIVTVWGMKCAKSMYGVFTLLTILTMVISSASFSPLYLIITGCGITPFLVYTIFAVRSGVCASTFERISGQLKLGFFIWFVAIFVGTY